MQFVTAEQLAQLRCDKCKNYLSFFPIYCSSDPLGYVCGRCSEGDDSSRNVVYEQIAALHKFPCRNDINGCIENLLPKEVPLHEQFCKFRTYNCPTNHSTGCDWQGTSSDIWQHFHKKHTIYIIRKGQFEVDFLGSYRENYLLEFENEMYVVSETNKNNIFSCNVYYIGTNAYALNNLYKLTFQNAMHRDIKIVSTNKLGEETSLDKDSIVDSLSNPTGVIAQIEILKQEEIDDEDYEEVQWDLISELECCCCMEYMLPPVQQCITGHSICSNCKQTQEVCPTCRKDFQNTVNITLGKLIDHLIYPCKNSPEGCKFTCKATDIKKHESNCPFGKLSCPLSDYENCTEKLSNSDLYDHILKCHYENVLEMNAVSSPLKKSENHAETSDEDEEIYEPEFEDCFILRYNFRLFKLHYKYLPSVFLWEMQLIGPPKKNEKYDFQIEFKDAKNRICFRTDCGTLSNKEDAFGAEKTFIITSLKQIRHLFKDDELLVYSVRILPKTVSKVSEK